MPPKTKAMTFDRSDLSAKDMLGKFRRDLATAELMNEALYRLAVHEDPDFSTYEGTPYAELKDALLHLLELMTGSGEDAARIYDMVLESGENVEYAMKRLAPGWVRFLF